MSPATDATEMVRSWLDRLVACDVEGLAGMYHPEARFTALSEEWVGRQEIEDGLSLARRWIRGIAVEDVAPIHGASGAWTFDTIIKGRLGRATVRHTWQLDHGGITTHAMALVRHDKQA